MSCDTCYIVEIPECPENITVKAQLEANEQYFIVITDKFGKRYSQEVETDSEGSFTLDLSDIPAGTFNRHAGSFTIEAFLEENSTCEPELMQFCCEGVVSDYRCVSMSFFQSDLGSLETVIGCDCPE